MQRIRILTSASGDRAEIGLLSSSRKDALQPQQQNL
jgi:hypothetical protein